jgi:hypothetical protein
MLRVFQSVILVGAIGAVACQSGAVAAPSPVVTFAFAPRACSSVVPVQFLIDGLQVGTDTFRVAVAGGDHLTSRGFATSPGQHVLSARTATYAWAETTVTLFAGQAYTDSLPFYCS